MKDVIDGDGDSFKIASWGSILCLLPQRTLSVLTVLGRSTLHWLGLQYSSGIGMQNPYGVLKDIDGRFSQMLRFKMHTHTHTHTHSLKVIHV